MTWKISSESLQENRLLEEESLFFTGNGYIGVRGNFEEGRKDNTTSIRGTYLNAFHDIVTIPYGEKLFAFPDTQQKLLNVIDAQTIYLYFGEENEEEMFSLHVGEVLSYERQLHLDKGYSERIIHWRSPLGKEVNIHYKRLVSFVEKEVFIQNVTIHSVNYKGRIKIKSIVNGDVSNYVNPNDPRVSSGHAKLLNITACSQNGDLSYVEVETYRSGLKAACGTAYDLHPTFQRKDIVEDSQIISEFVCELTDHVVFEKKNVYVDTLRHSDELFEAVTTIQKRLRNIPFSDLLQKQQEYLRLFWDNGDVRINGSDSLQEGIRFNLFSLLQSTGKDRVSNIAAKGLSGEGYEGHYFWDTEIYMFPVFLMTNPDIAKQLLLYRYSILDNARSRAKEMGHAKGALFPWRTISGSECSSYFPAGTAQYHISADIAYSFIQYYLVTKDESFLSQFGAEVLFETARLWFEVGHFKDGLFKIDAVTGPDEYTCIVNNNYYTNVMSKHNLKWAAKIFDLLHSSAPEALAELMGRIGLTDTEPDKWLKAANMMYLPYDEKLQLNPQDDTFLEKAVWDLSSTPKDKFPLLLHYHPLTLYRYQVCKQADTVLAHFLLEDEESLETIKNSFDYYENITTHDSSLSSCVFSIMASKLGYEDKAYNYFIETARLDLDNTHGNTKDGLHMANMGGTWLAIVFGFAGLRVKEESISFNPSLPDKWEGYSFSLTYQGRQLRIEITKKQTIITLSKGERLNIHVDGSEYELIEVEPLIVKK